MGGNPKILASFVSKKIRKKLYQDVANVEEVRWECVADADLPVPFLGLASLPYLFLPFPRKHTIASKAHRHTQDRGFSRIHTESQIKEEVAQCCQWMWKLTALKRSLRSSRPGVC